MYEKTLHKPGVINKYVALGANLSKCSDGLMRTTFQYKLNVIQQTHSNTVQSVTDSNNHTCITQ